MFFFFNDTATTEIYTLSLHDALPIYPHTADDVATRVQRHAAAEGDDAARDLPSPAARAARGSEEVRVEQVRLIQTPQGVARLRERVEHRGRESERIEAEGVSRVRLRP